MLFHVTITHSQQDCPGRRAAATPDLMSPGRPDLGDELTVTAHSVVWGAACILWAEPEHVAYALLEAASLEAVERYLEALTPAGWDRRTLPVFMLPGQLEAVRQALASPAMPSAQPATSVSEPARDLGSADTLKDLTAASSEAVDQQATLPPDEARVATVPPMAAVPPDKPPGERVTPTTPQPVVAEPSAPPDPGPRPDSSAVTRFIERPVIPAADEPRSSSETPTVILDPKSQRAPGMRLVASTGPAQGSIFDVGEEGATLGRLPENSICLTDGRLSRHHASVEFRDGGYWLKDLGSQNGTLVNDHALTEPHLLQAGDTIELGTTRLTVMLDSDD